MNLSNYEGVVSLDENQMVETNGGILPLLLVAGEVYAGVCLLAYAVGYTAGTISKL